MEELQYFERIEAYQDGQMSPIERQQFETDLEINEQLKSEYDAFIATTVALEWMVAEDFSKEQEDTQRNKFTLIKNKKSWIAIAASFLFLLFIGAGSFAKLNYSNETIVQDFYRSPNWTNTIRGQENETSRTKINLLLVNEDYQKLISYLEETQNDNSDYNYLLANAYLKNKQANKAITTFQEVILSSNKDTKASAEWYLILSYLQNGDNEKAQNQLKFIIQNKHHPNYHKALELEEKLNSFWRNFII